MTYAIWPKPNHCPGAGRTFVRVGCNVERRRRRAIEKVGQEVLSKREAKKKKVKINGNPLCTWPGDPPLPPSKIMCLGQ